MFLSHEKTKQNKQTDKNSCYFFLTEPLPLLLVSSAETWRGKTSCCGKVSLRVLVNICFELTKL